MPQTIRLTEHNKTEFLRLAADCRKHKRPDAATFFEAQATKDEMPIHRYDKAMRYYRGWLLQGFPQE